jgi:rhodanese-related sulfurtransferase
MKKFDSVRAKSGIFCLLLMVFIFAGLVDCKTADAYNEEEAGSDAPSDRSRRPSHPYCGLYCLYTVQKLFGKEVNFKNLLKHEYVGSPKGSSMAQLKKAAGDLGMYALPMGKLSISQLRVCKYPVILHLKSDPIRWGYDHFELFLGVKGGKARIYNPPNPVEWIPFHELVPLWDGTGLILSPSPIDVSEMYKAAGVRFLVYVTLLVGVILVVRWRRQRWLAVMSAMSLSQRLRLSVLQSAGFVVAAVLFGMFYHFANDAGFLANNNAVGWVEHGHATGFMPKISKNQVNRLLKENTVFVDARFATDYNAPVDSNDVARHAALTDVAKDTPIVVYCQSKNCSYAEVMAFKLKEDGFSNLSLFKGGWQEWQTKNN